jgi:sugar lactone lactonase YvrE
MRKVAPCLLALILSLCGTLLVGLHSTRAQEEPPLVKRIGPDVVVTGTPTFTLRLEGKKFVTGAQLLFDGAPLAGSRVTPNGKLALAEIDSSIVEAVGSHTVQLVNPGGAASAIFTLEVVAPDPDLRMRLGGNAAQEDLGQNFQFLVTGEDFNENSEAVIWGSTESPTTFVSDTELIVEFPAEFGTEPARVPIMIHNKGSRFSNVEIFFIVPAPAELSFVDPDSVEVGTEPFEIDVRGSNFKPGAQLVVGGVPLETTSRKNGRLRATVPGELRSAPGLLRVRVEQEGQQSADLTIIVAPSEAPFIFTISPSRIRVGEKKPTLDITGANFGNNVTAFIDGLEAKIRASTRRRLTVLIPAALLESAGTHHIEVKDEDGNTSNMGSFVVVPDVTVSTLVGEEKEGFNEGCVSSEEARLRRPRRLAIGPDGLLYLTDQHNHSIRTINLDTGQVCTVTGTGLPGYHDTGNVLGEPPTFSYPNGIAFDASGTIFVTENGNNVVRRIRRIGGTVTVDTYAGQRVEIRNPDRQQRLNSTLDGQDGFRDGEASNAAFRLPDEIIAASDGSIYLADPLNHSIRRITQSGGQVRVETIAGNGVPGFADGFGINARFNTPMSVALSSDETFLFVADMANFRIRRMNLQTGRVETLAGTGEGSSLDGPATEASFARPIGLELGAGGVLYVAELDGNAIRRIDPDGNVSTIAGDPSVKKFRDGEGSRATFNGPRGLAFDAVRNVLYVADYENFRIRAIALD